MSLDAAFRFRAKEVRAYLRSLQALERVHNVPGRGFYRAAAAITASRASAFIMIYNCVEYATREAIVSLRSEMEAKAGDFGILTDYWQEEIVRAQFHEPLRQGANYVDFLKGVTKFMPGRVDWGGAKNALPFPGNVDQEEIFRFVRRIGFRWTSPRAALGGSDLLLVRKTRNDLAHGIESFEAVGARYSTQDIVEKFIRIRAFMLSFLSMIARYRTRQLYQRS